MTKLGSAFRSTGILSIARQVEVSNKVLDELCMDPDCRKKPAKHWHPFSENSILAEGDGEYTITVRVRDRVKRRKPVDSG